MPKAVIKQTDPATPVEILAKDIRSIAEGFRQLSNGPMKRDTLIVLIQHHSVGTDRLSRTAIGQVLDAIENLDIRALKK